MHTPKGFHNTAGGFPARRDTPGSATPRATYPEGVVQPRAPCPAASTRHNGRCHRPFNTIDNGVQRMRLASSVLCCLAALAGATASHAADRPNILWLIAEDLGPELACYGTSQVTSPNLDRLAAEGVRYTRAYTTAPVCSASRSAFMTGMYQTTIGAHNHRSHRDDDGGGGGCGA